jgi:hypothetical protein
MNKTLLTLLFLVCISATKISAQGFTTYGDAEDRTLRVFSRYTTVKPGADGRYGGFTFNAGMALNNYNRFRMRVRYENPTIGDLLFYVKRLWTGGQSTTDSGLEHAFGGGLMGWLQFYKNVVATDRFMLSPGISMGDYIFGVEQRINGSVVTYDPAGWFIGAGPGIMMSYHSGNKIWVDTYAYYDMMFGTVEYSHAGYIRTEGYPKPHFITYGIDVCHEKGFFTGFRMCIVNDRGSTNITASRIDVSLGYHFKEFDKN